ncbi:contact-dependent growth inhibition system immunity protein [Streptomyces sp. NPDC088762]|uniref:contact-dependent growth inhibition system immunity protein n=1 Tax=Streptomyces sp. NPDC088762 TaxID=3365891 RepID=UPI00380DD228
MNKHPERSRTLDELEGIRWPDPPLGSTGLVRTVHMLRRKPISELTAYELGRLIGQDVGLRWTLPLAIEILRDAASRQAEGGFFDDDLLSAVLTRSAEVWSAHPGLAAEVREVVGTLTDLSPYLESDVDGFRKASEGKG